MGLDALSLKSTPSSPDKSAGTPPAFWLFELMGFKTSGIRQQGGPLTAEMMGDPGLLQEGPDVSTLLPKGGDDREQTAAAQGSLGRLDAVADQRGAETLAHVCECPSAVDEVFSAGVLHPQDVDRGAAALC